MLLIAKKLVPEVKRYCLNNPIVLVESKIDLSNISEANLSNTGAKNNPAKIGERLAQAIKAKEHIGTFSNGKRVDKVFEKVAFWAITRRTKEKEEFPIIKIGLLGDQIVGKASLMYQFLRSQVCVNTAPTLGADVNVGYSQIEGVKYKLHIFDFGGSRYYEKNRNFWYEVVDFDAFILVFSVVNADSFKNIKKWVKKLQSSFLAIPIILVGNKTDLRRNFDEVTLKSQHITLEMGKEMAKEINAAKYLESSCLHGSGIHSVFNAAVNASYRLKHKPRKTTLSFNIVVIGVESDSSTSIARQFAFDERLSVLGERLNDFSERLNEKSDLSDSVSTIIENDGEEYCLNISNMVDFEKTCETTILKCEEADVILMVILAENVDFRQSILSFLAEVKHYCPNAPIILVGDKRDLNNYAKPALNSSATKESGFSSMMHKQLELNGEMYMEYSSTVGGKNGVESIFVEAVWSALRCKDKKHQKLKSKPKKSKLLQFFDRLRLR